MSRRGRRRVASGPCVSYVGTGTGTGTGTGAARGACRGGGQW